MSYFIPLNDTGNRTTPPPGLLKISSNSLDEHIKSPVPDTTVTSISSPDSGTKRVQYNFMPEDVSSSNNNAIPFLVTDTTRKVGLTKSYEIKARERFDSESHQDEDDADDEQDATNPDGTRRQQRLERNRESARMSRRRRKQYLEILEDKVHSLGEDLDRARRQHVDVAVPTLEAKRLHAASISSGMHPALARASQELMVANTFQREQLRSLILPPTVKFITWLTLQNEDFFNGGRRPSERLSAARIGERLLQSGEDKVGPFDSLWPLVCNEVNLSYDQEEKVRALQRVVLQTPESWLDRHVVYASGRVTQSTHDAVQALTLRTGQRESSNLDVLTNEQRTKFASWSARNRSRVASFVQKMAPAHTKSIYEIDPSAHEAANLYVINYKMESVLETIPRAAPMVTGASLKKFSRRPLFEPLSGTDSKGLGKEDGKTMSRTGSYASSGSLKRNASEMSMDGDERPPQLSPLESQSTAAALVERKIGHLKDIIPTSTSPTSSLWTNFPAPTPVAAMMTRHVQSVPNFPTHQQEPSPKHQRQGSFLPIHLNAVPELPDMIFFDDDGGADDILASLVDDDDWAVGVGMGLDL